VLLYIAQFMPWEKWLWPFQLLVLSLHFQRASLTLLGVSPWVGSTFPFELFSCSMLTLCSYALQWLIAMPLEVMAASITIQYWDVPVPQAVFITIFLAAIILVNLGGVKAFGEAEYFFSVMKVTAVIGFM
jgi:amino acid transporter